MRRVEGDDLAPRVYRAEGSDHFYVVPDGGVRMEHRERSLSPRREVGSLRQVSWGRSGLMERDEGFSDRGDVREPHLRGGLMERDEEFGDGVNVMQHRMKLPTTYRQVHEEFPRYHYQDAEMGRRYEFDYVDRYEAAGTGVNYEYEYEYDNASRFQGHDVNRERVLDSGRDHELDKQKLLALEDRSSWVARRVPFDSESALKYMETRLPVPEHPQKTRLRDEVSHYPDPFLLEKLWVLENLERERRSRFHPEDVSNYMESASRSKNLVGSSQRKECLTTSSGISRMNYASVVHDDVHMCGDIHSRSSTMRRQPLSLDEYGDKHIYNTLEGYAARHKEQIGHQYDKACPLRGENVDYLYHKGMPRDASDYGHSYERTSLRGQAVLDKRHARAQILLEPFRENASDDEFPRQAVTNSSSLDHHSLNKQSVSRSFLDGRSSVRSSQGQFFVDSGDTNVGAQNRRDLDVRKLDIPCHEEIPPRRVDYHSSKDGYYDSYDERSRRSPWHGHEMEILRDRVRFKKTDSGVIGCDDYPPRSVKRKYVLDEETMGHSSRPVVLSKWTRTQDIDYGSEVRDDQDMSGLLSPESFEDDKCIRKAERTYRGDLYGGAAACNGLLSYQGQRNLIKPYNHGEKQNVYENPSSVRHNDLNPCNRTHRLAKNVWIRGKDDKQTEASHHVAEVLKDQAARAKTELPDDSLEFKKLVHDFFLSFSKKLNESFATKNRYKEQGRAGGLYCIVCGKSQSKEFKDTRALASHCFMSSKVGLKAKHLGLHKAICVLMGWNSDTPPADKLWVPLAAPNALTQKEDLILWPPVVLIHNYSAFATDIDVRKVVTAEAVEDFLRGKGFSGGRIKVCLGNPANGTVLLVKFIATIPGFQDAEKLHNYFKGEERGRKDFELVMSTKGKNTNTGNVKTDNMEELLLYGYMGIAEDLDKVDNDSKWKCLIKSKKEIREFIDGPVIPVTGD